MSATDDANPYRILLERLNAAETEAERDWLTLEFSLKSLPASLQALIWAAAVPHWFDRDFLAVLQTCPPSEEDFAALLSLTFVELYPERGHAVHERTRALLLDRFWHNDVHGFRIMSTRAAIYCDTNDHRQDAPWRVEAAYHWLVTEPKVGSSKLTDTGLDWQYSPDFSYNKLEALARAGREHLDAGRLDERAEAWVLFWEACLDQVFSRYNAAHKKLLHILRFPELEPSMKADCLVVLGHVNLSLSEIKEAQTSYKQALLIYQTIANRRGEADCLIGLGDVCLSLAQTKEARTSYEQALLIYRTIGNRRGEARCLYALGDVHHNLSETRDARESYEQALSTYKAIGSSLNEANSWRALGDVYCSLSEAIEAWARYEQARLIYQAMGNRLGEANCLVSLGNVYLSLSKTNEARARYEQARSIYQAMNITLGVAICFKGLGDVRVKLSEPREARSLYEQALLIFQTLGSKLSEANCWRGLGDCWREQRDYEMARKMYTNAAAIMDSIDCQEGKAECLESFAELHAAMGDGTRAIGFWEEAETLYRNLGLPKRADLCLDAANRQRETIGVHVPVGHKTLPFGGPKKITKLLVGESLVGEGNEVAHIDLLIGPSGSAAELAFANALVNNKDGFTTLLVVLAPNLLAKPNTILFNKVTIKGAKQAVQMFGPAQAGVAKAVVDSVAEGVIPAVEADDLFICVGVFIHWDASDDAKIQDYNYQATKEALARAIRGEPSPADVVAKRWEAKHPFVAH